MELIAAPPRLAYMETVGVVLAALVGLLLGGCGQQTAMPDSGEGTTGAVPVAPEQAQASSETAVLATADCPSRRSSGGTLDYLAPSTRSEAAAWPQSPYEAARDTQTAPAFEAGLAQGELVERKASGRTVVYAVMEGDREIGRLTVRSVGFGAFATSQVEACSP